MEAVVGGVLAEIDFLGAEILGAVQTRDVADEGEVGREVARNDVQQRVEPAGGGVEASLQHGAFEGCGRDGLLLAVVVGEGHGAEWSSGDARGLVGRSTSAKALRGNEVGA